MLYINQKYKPIITKPVEKQQPDFNNSIMPSIQGQGINELIQKVKDMKVKDLNKKKNTNSKISFD